MTPEEAIALEPGTTPGPWEAYEPGDGTARMYAGEGEEARPLLHNVDSDPHTACVYFTREDGELMAAAPDLAHALAAMAEEWGVEADGNALFPVNEEWHPNGEYFTECRADAEAVRDRMAKLNPHVRYRLVCRLVGPVEVVE